MQKAVFFFILIISGCTSTKTKSDSGDQADVMKLHDIWALKELSGRVLSAEDYTREAPYMEIHVADKKVMGTTSCNGFSGSVDITGHKIKFGQLVSTRMACAKSIEPEFLKMLEEIDGYKYEGLYLVLMKSDKELGKFLKVD